MRGVTESDARRRHQRYVAALLDELEARRQRLYVLKAYGARAAALRDLKAELEAFRDELAAAVDAAAGSPDETRRPLPVAAYRVAFGSEDPDGMKAALQSA
jgi:hypothetical protein